MVSTHFKRDILLLLVSPVSISLVRGHLWLNAPETIGVIGVKGVIRVNVVIGVIWVNGINGLIGVIGLFVGRNFRHETKNSSLSPDEKFRPIKVNVSLVEV